MDAHKPSPDWLIGFQQDVEEELRKLEESRALPAQAPETAAAATGDLASEIVRDLESHRSRLETLRAELDAMTKLHPREGDLDLLAALPKLAEEILGLLRHLAAVHARIQRESAEVGRERNALDAARAMLEGQLADMRTKVAAAQEGYEARIRTLRSEVQALQDQKKVLEANGQIHSARLERVEAELQRLLADKLVAEKKSLELQGRVSNLEGIRTDLLTQNASLQGALDELRRQKS